MGCRMNVFAWLVKLDVREVNTFVWFAKENVCEKLNFWSRNKYPLIRKLTKIVILLVNWYIDYWTSDFPPNWLYFVLQYSYSCFCQPSFIILSLLHGKVILVVAPNIYLVSRITNQILGNNGLWPNTSTKFLLAAWVKTK